MTLVYILAFLLVCAAPVLLAVLILKNRDRAVERSGEKGTKHPSVSLVQDVLTLITVVMMITIGAFILRLLIPDTWRIKYAVLYRVDTDSVEIEHRPYNCDWDSAPIGSKHCHYENNVTVLNTQDQIVGGTNIALAPDHSRISFDGGKTWTPAPFNTKAFKVYVEWKRIED